MYDTIVLHNEERNERKLGSMFWSKMNHVLLHLIFRCKALQGYAFIKVFPPLSLACLTIGRQ